MKLALFHSQPTDCPESRSAHFAGQDGAVSWSPSSIISCSFARIVAWNAASDISGSGSILLPSVQAPELPRKRLGLISSINALGTLNLLGTRDALRSQTARRLLRH
jgi:hypothetical protein